MRPLSTLFVFALASSMACGGGTSSEAPKSAAAPKESNDGGASPANNAKDAGATEERPFAGSIAEATSLISAAVDKKQNEVSACVREFRTRRKMAREKVAVSVGIDQDGRLLGVTSKGKEDSELKACVQDALKSVVFPRSHAGVITVTKTYEELLQ